MSDEDWFTIFRTRFFDRVKGTEFKSMNVASVVVDMSFMSGAFEAIETLQEAINLVRGINTVKVDGRIGDKTLLQANTIDPLTLIKAIVTRRKNFFTQITNDNTPQELKNKTFLKGWINRTNDYLKSYCKGL